MIRLLLILLLLVGCGGTDVNVESGDNQETKCKRIKDERVDGMFEVVTICDGEPMAVDSFYTEQEADEFLISGR